jgi:hypothetical protein
VALYSKARQVIYHCGSWTAWACWPCHRLLFRRCSSLGPFSSLLGDSACAHLGRHSLIQAGLSKEQTVTERTEPPPSRRLYASSDGDGGRHSQIFAELGHRVSNVDNQSSTLNVSSPWPRRVPRFRMTPPQNLVRWSHEHQSWTNRWKTRHRGGCGEHNSGEIRARRALSSCCRVPADVRKGHQSCHSLCIVMSKVIMRLSSPHEFGLTGIIIDSGKVNRPPLSRLDGVGRCTAQAGSWSCLTVEY